jgi:NAD(P)-dependent dehydrogenase (short-subunit alcohol dehydrogenase family)
LNTSRNDVALIVGAGDGLSASIARRFRRAGLRIALRARNTSKLSELGKEIKGDIFGCDVAKSEQVTQLFDNVEREMGAPDVVVYNPSARARGPLAHLEPADVERSLAVTAFGGFLVA